ncbi:hypothetical protein ACQEVB_07010 [Pseudonocardia sp. CA-107938]|uniref:hypothetical protein n=1 Tax=Pseudonocardia sp. CA-107938 TaxID=3240021 RepID=UPI003D8F391C
MHLRIHAGSAPRGTIARPFAEGLWEVVSDRDAGGQAADVDELFRRAVADAVEAPHRRSVVQALGVEIVQVHGRHPAMAAHVHVLPRHLDLLFDDGALVGFPLPDLLLAVPITGYNRHPLVGAQVLQALLDEAAGISTQVYWWKPTAQELAPPVGALRRGHRPDLRPVAVTPRRNGGTDVVADADFLELCQRL